MGLYIECVRLEASSIQAFEAQKSNVVQSHQTVNPMYSYSNRVSQYVSDFRFFYSFIMRQPHLLPQVPKLANFCISLQNLRAEIELCVNFLGYCAVTKLHKIENQYFSVSVLCPSSSKQKLTVPLEKHTVFELLHLQNSFFKLF